MADRYDIVSRLEPDHTAADPAGGIGAETADSLWMLGRQWRLGEHQAEDAASPVRVTYRASLVPIRAPGADPLLSPTLTPPEPVIEAGADDFWTPGRRVAAGRAVARAVAQAGVRVPGDPNLRLAGLPVPYDVLDGTGLDGRALWARREELSLAAEWFGEHPPEEPPRDLWDPARLTHHGALSAGAANLRVAGHDGGEPLDWFAFDADRPVEPPASPPEPTTVLPDRVRWPGAPAPRWWQIEDRRHDPGAYPSDPGHFPTLLVLEALSAHSGNWFSFPVPATPGHVLTLHEVTVHDACGDTWTLEPPGDWSLFAVSGLDRGSLVVWPPGPAALAGPVIDAVDLGFDEEAELVWAVERRADGRELPTDPPPAAPTPDRVNYAATADVPEHWHPYVVETVAGRRRFVQGRLADLSGPALRLAPEPLTGLLADPTAGGRHPVHQLDPALVPTDGLRLERRWMLARRSDGRPVLWTQRGRVPLGTPPALRLRTDALEQRQAT